MKTRTIVAIGLMLVLLVCCSNLPSQRVEGIITLDGNSPCPPRPQRIPHTPTPTPSRWSYLTVLREYTLLGEGTFIKFKATADTAEDVAEFGTVEEWWGRETYRLKIDTTHYSYQEVGDYLNTWDECHVSILVEEVVPAATPTPTPTPTLEPGRVNIAVGQALYGAIDGDKCYADIPLCGNGLVCPVEYGREVPCGDWETTIVYSTPAPTPTPTPEISVFDESIRLPNEWSVLPEADWTFEFDWSGDIIITDALSRTVTVAGPAMVRFEEAVEDTPYLTNFTYLKATIGDAELESLNIDAKCIKLLDIDVIGSDTITVTWADGLAHCEIVDGLNMSIGGEIFQAWRCGNGGVIHIDWRNRKQGECDD